MSKQYIVQVQFGKTWATVTTTNRHIDALDYVRTHAGESCPMRIVRIVKTIVFVSK